MIRFILEIKEMGVIVMERIPVIFQGKDYLILVQYDSGYCEILKEGETKHQVQLVHFSELKIKNIQK